MARLEELTPGAAVRGILPDSIVTVVAADWFGANAIRLTYTDAAGKPGQQLLYRDNEPTIEIAQTGRPWSFDGDGALLRLVSEAYRIRLAYLFDPYLAVQTSLVEPLPHQITAVYGEMLKRQPLRFLLADDPGAGKTIMTGLFIKELMARGDLQRCLIVCPGSLAEQWQDELDQRFHVAFEIMTNDKIEAARTGNWFLENPLAICRLDKLSRNEDLQLQLEQVDWDLIVVDEAHKMSASFFSGEVKETKRYKLGRALSRVTRHFLLLTATPHNGKEEDFQLFLALLDGDRFEGRFRDGVHVVDTSDLMRRMIKEQLLKFDGTPLFPERRAYPVQYPLSDMEAALYKAVTDYVREEFNRAEAQSEGRKGTVGFALTMLQRRLASSPEAIYQSLRRRRERLEKRLTEEELLHRGAQVSLDWSPDLPELRDDDIDDLDEAPEAEVEQLADEVVDKATAARTIDELRAEIQILTSLEQLAYKVRQSRTDRKWDELSKLLNDKPEMFDENRRRFKLVIFTEHRDTLNYLTERIRSLLGRPDAVVEIHGGMGRDERRKHQELFMQDRDVEVLVATDAAGEGINLQRAHLMVNYDLPWNPNRIEQRFGRIHRIGQTEVCHLWNLIAKDTREGEVFDTLFKKLEEQRKALGGQVFDVLGKLTFDERPLRDLLVEAVRYGDRPDDRAKLTQVVEKIGDSIRQLVEERALAHDAMDASRVRAIREDMERAEARRLQPHFIASFFIAAFQRLGGTIHEREPKRFEVTHVPAEVRARDRQIGTRAPVLNRYERITFHKELVHVPSKPLAEFVCPGDPLLDAVSDLTRERNRDLLKRGAVLIDENDWGTLPRTLVYLEHAIQDARTDTAGNRRIVSRRMEFVEILADGTVRRAGYAPYLDYRPTSEEERQRLSLDVDGLRERADLENQAIGYAIENVVPEHLGEVKERKGALVAKTLGAVRDRLMKEIAYWDHRAEDLKAQELAGRTPRLNSGRARQRADELESRLKRREVELEQERHVSSQPPIVIGAVLVVPQGLLALRGCGDGLPNTGSTPEQRRRIEQVAMDAVIAAERALGFDPRSVASENVGYDVESRVPGTGKLRFIEVKGRVAGASTVSVTKNEILTALNKPDDFILAIVSVDGSSGVPVYVWQPFQREPDFAVTSVNYDLSELLARAVTPV